MNHHVPGTTDSAPRQEPARAAPRSCLRLAIFVLATCLASVGCRQVPAQQGLLERTAGEAQSSSTKLRAILTDYVARYSDRIEEAADQILAQATDVETRRNAILWKSNGIAACMQAASRPDPLGALIDVWVLNRQMNQLFEQRPLFGPWQGIALQTTQQLDQELRRIHQSLGTDLPIGEPFVEAFARDFPVSSLYFVRESLSASYTRYIDEIDEPDRELLEIVASLNNDLDELRKLSALYARFLPKQTRWQAELFLMESLQLEGLAQSLRDVTVASQAASRMAAVTETVPLLAERERQAFLQTFQQERVATLQDMDRMRAETLDVLRDERVEILGTMQQERAAVSDSVAASLDTALRQTDDITRQRTDDLAQHGEQLLDHAFRRLLQLLAVCAAAAAVSAVIWLRFRRSSRVSLPTSTPALPAESVPMSARAHGFDSDRSAAA